MSFFWICFLVCLNFGVISIFSIAVHWVGTLFIFSIRISVRATPKVEVDQLSSTIWFYFNHDDDTPKQYSLSNTHSATIKCHKSFSQQFPRKIKINTLIFWWRMLHSRPKHRSKRNQIIQNPQAHIHNFVFLTWVDFPLQSPVCYSTQNQLHKSR